VLGVSVLPLRSAGNVAKFVEQARKVVDDHRKGVERYATVLKERLAALNVDPQAGDRLRTAQAAHAFVAAVTGARREGVVEAIAGAQVETSEAAMGAALKKAEGLANALEHTRWDLLRSDLALPDPFGQQAA